MDLIPPIPGNSPLQTPLTPVFGDNVQDLLNAGALNVKPTAIIVVNSIDDVADKSVGVTTLRDAVKQANADSKEDLIVFDRSLFSSQQTITLKLGELDITHNLDIIAPLDSLTGGDLVTVSGNKASRVFEIETAATVNLSGLIVADGSATNGNGGGILNSGTLTLDSSIIRNHSATDFRGTGGGPIIAGGGIYSTGTLKLTNSTISGNSVSGGTGRGGGLFSGGTLAVSNSTISGNSASGSLGGGLGSGGGIYGADTSTISNSTISNNSVNSQVSTGGGIYGSGTLTVSNTTISNNVATVGGIGAAAGGGIFGGTVTVSDSTISGNRASAGRGAAGGGIYSETLTLNNSTISNNSANERGGGIFSGGLTVSNSTISGNSSTVGGGIYNSGSRISTVSNSTISSNTARRQSNVQFADGGGIFNSGNLTVTNSTINSNSAGNNGGGISNGGNLTVTNSTINSNSGSSGGGIFNNGALTVNKSTISGNSSTFGGGICIGNENIFSNANPNPRNNTISNSTISSNNASSFGGGIFNAYNLTVTNTTISSNSASNSAGSAGSGGGIFNGSGTLTLVFSTLTQNQANNGGGVFNGPYPFFVPTFPPSQTNPNPPGTTSVRNTIIAANLVAGQNGANPDVSGTFNSNGYNLIGESTGSTGFDQAKRDIVGTSAKPINPNLDLLNSNGGSTQTIALLPDSPAINAGDPTLLPTDPTTDQRGKPRVRGGRADIGTFESSLTQ